MLEKQFQYEVLDEKNFISKTIFKDRKELENWLNKKGQEGWELVSRCSNEIILKKEIK